MNYINIQPPFALNFESMDKASLKIYTAWFRKQFPQRIATLELAVRSTKGYEKWRADCGPESLILLGHWYAAHIETRPKTVEELCFLIDGLADVADHDQELTNQTFSLAMDVAMYISNTLIAHNPALKWEQKFRSKRFVDYGQPLIAGSGKVSFNPVRMMVTLAYGIAGRKRNGEDLRKIFDIWSNKLQSQPFVLAG